MQGKIVGATGGRRSLLAVSIFVALVLGAVVPSVLADEERLSAVEVRAGQDETKVQPKLRDDIIKTDVIDAQDIRRTNAATLNEAVANNPGVDVQVECSICNVRNVTLNNLPGRFTTIMIDGVPIFSSVSGAYGLDMIGINGVESIDISRGAGTSLIAPEALSGVVNIVSRRPQTAERVLEVQGGEYGYRRLDGFLTQPFAGGAATLSVSANHHDSVDHNGNGISEYSGYQRALGGLGLFLDDVGGFRVRGRLDVVSEKRGGGAMGVDYGAIKADMSGNPFDWSRGKHGSPDSSCWVNPGDGSIVAYDSGRGGMSEIIFTDRVQGIVNGDRPLDGGARLKLAFGYANHKQDSFYEGDIYKADQDQIYVETSLQRPVGDTLLTLGLNYRFEDLRSNGLLSDAARQGKRSEGG
jgi:outer membrane receptor for ferrienterochelin and colicins